MKSKKYYILTENGHLEIKDAVKFENGYNLDLFQFRDKYGVNISEGESGLKLFTGNISQDALQNRINSIGGINELKKLIENKINEYGLSPRHK